MSFGPARVLSYDPDSGIREIFQYDPDEDKTVIYTEQDISGIIRRNRAFYAATDERAGWKGDLHWVGSIPLVTYHQLVKQGIISWGGEIRDQERLTQWLNDSQNRDFRTRPGTV